MHEAAAVSSFKMNALWHSHGSISANVPPASMAHIPTLQMSISRESWEQGRSGRHRHKIKIDTRSTQVMSIKLSCHSKVHSALPWLPLQADHRFAAGAVQTYLWRVPASLRRYWQAPVTCTSWNGQGHTRSEKLTAIVTVIQTYYNVMYIYIYIYIIYICICLLPVNACT